ncbi:MAG: DivIVA domain-containing protein [Clostridiales bacterium]|nr:DivIVA domain-containing protein [Clostridiales bacterium]
MAITIAMIEEKEFKTKMRGYDPVEVDEFLDEICDEMAAMQEEIATLNQRLGQSGGGRPAAYAPIPAAAPGAIPTPVPAPLAVEKPMQKPVEAKEESAKEKEASESAQKLLLKAQKVYDDTVQDAKDEAEKILAEAKEKADAAIGSLAEEKESLESEVEMLRASARDYRERFLNLLRDQQHVLKAEKELFD